MTDLRYPILMVHGMGFHDVNMKTLGYWGRIPKALEDEGCTLYYGGQDSNGSIEDNGRFLCDRIRDLCSEHGIEKFNVIAHSKGGLDIRYAISTLGIGDRIASLSTISTPHNGSITVDKLMRFPDFMIRFVCGICDIWLRFRGDRKPGTYRAIRAFTTKEASIFNENNPDREGIYYQSFAFTYKTFFSDVLLWFPHFVVKMVEGENDGLLTPRAVRWGDFRGVYTGTTNRGISHCDEVDLRRRPLSKRKAEAPGEVSDITEVYVDIVRRLKEKGL